MNLGRKIFVSVFVPLSISCTILSASCNKQTIINCNFSNDLLEEDWNNLGFSVSKADFNKVFNQGDIIQLDFTTKDGRHFTPEMPYIKEFSESGYYTSSIIDKEMDDGEIKVMFAVDLWPSINNVKVKDQMCGQPVKVVMKNKSGFLDTMNLAHCDKKLTYEEVGRIPDTYANFRDISVTGSLSIFINQGKIYRGAAPFARSESKTRHLHVNNLLENKNICYDICISADEEKFKSKVESSFSEDAYVRKEIINKNNFMAINFQTDFFSDGAQAKVKEVLKKIANLDKNTSFYFHCDEGKDRTGFFAVLLEMFATSCKTSYGIALSVDLDDIIADFMLSYKNYYNITLADNIERYQTIAKLTAYRHVYAIMLEHSDKENIGTVPWSAPSFDVRVAVNKKLEQHDLWWYANRYIRMVLKDEPEIENIIANLQSKLYVFGIPENKA